MPAVRTYRKLSLLIRSSRIKYQIDSTGPANAAAKRTSPIKGGVLRGRRSVC